MPDLKGFFSKRAKQPVPSESQDTNADAIAPSRPQPQPKVKTVKAKTKPVKAKAPTGKNTKPDKSPSPFEKTVETLQTVDTSCILELLFPRLLQEQAAQLAAVESQLTSVNARIEKLTAQREDVLRVRAEQLNQSFN